MVNYNYIYYNLYIKIYYLHTFKWFIPINYYITAYPTILIFNINKVLEYIIIKKKKTKNKKKKNLVTRKLLQDL